MSQASRQASRKLVAFLRSKGVYERYMPASCGTWTEGSCLRLAVAVEEWARLSGVDRHDGVFAVIRRWSDSVIEHVLYAVGPEGHRLFIDGNGVQNANDLFRNFLKWRTDYNDYELDVGVSPRVAYGADAARPGPSMKRLGAELYERFGPVQEFV